ncbi:MAG: L,D-transpeptidase family protein, partial [Woeseiaceae bacterium]|nr:L,D-transpeptidase family protein [Woeseiaceae bacterium]
IGRQDWETPLGRTRIISKVVNPAWYPPQSVKDEHAADGRPLPNVVPPGPDNPLGKHAMRLDIPGYLIHGTNRPAGVGMRVTHGCLRMFPEDIEYLFDHVSLETPVRIINEPVKIGWQGEQLVMEVHPVLESGPIETRDEPVPDTDSGESNVAADDNPAELSDASNEQPDSAPDIDVVVKDPLTYVTEQFVVATSNRDGQLDWVLVEEVVRRADGLPVAVGESIKNAAASAASE